MEPYVLALQLYLFNKACGGLPLRIAEQVVITGVINTAWWTAKTVGSGVIWLIQPSSKSTTISVKTLKEPDMEFAADFEIISPEQIIQLEKESSNSHKEN